MIRGVPEEVPVEAELEVVQMLLVEVAVDDELV